MSSQSKPWYRVLLVDDDETIRYNLKDYLVHYHEAPYQLAVDEAGNAQDALAFLAQNTYELLICDINLPDKDGFSILRETMKDHPQMKLAMITAYDLETYIPVAKAERVYNIMTKSAPFDFAELSLMVNNLLNPYNAFGLSKYLKPNATLYHRDIQSSNDIMIAQDALKTFFLEHNVSDIDALSVVMVEAITNAVYHAPRNPDGSERYQKGQEIPILAPDEVVFITYGYDNDKLGVSIRDQGGSVNADEIMHWLERNFTGNSLMDTHGRGVFLIHRLMDRVVMNIEPGKSTELVLLRYLRQTTHDNKPLYINVVP